MKKNESDKIGVGMSRDAVIQRFPAAQGLYFGTAGPGRTFGGPGSSILITDPQTEVLPGSHVLIIGKKGSGHERRPELPGKEDCLK